MHNRTPGRPKQFLTMTVRVDIKNLTEMLSSGLSKICYVEHVCILTHNIHNIYIYSIPSHIFHTNYFIDYKIVGMMRCVYFEDKTFLVWFYLQVLHNILIYFSLTHKWRRTCVYFADTTFLVILMYKISTITFLFVIYLHIT